MSFFRKKENDPDGAARRSAGLDALAHGRLTAEATARLGSPVRSTDLSCAEFLLTRNTGFESLGVVMGSAFHGLNMRNILTEQRSRYVGELEDLSRAHRAARDLAIDRLRQEASALGAHGVVGVKLTWKKVSWVTGMVECTAIGTAIRLEGGASTEHPFTSNLSGSEFWQLYVAGYIPRDIVFGASVYMVAGNYDTYSAMSPLWSENQEIERYSRGLIAARQLASRRLAEGVTRSGGSGAVGMEVEHHYEEHEYEINKIAYLDLLITFVAIGTSVLPRAEGAPEAPPKPRIGYDLAGGR